MAESREWGTFLNSGSFPFFFRYRSKGVLGKGVGNNKNASEMRQKCAKNAPKWVLFYLEKRNVPKCTKNASKKRQKCAEHLWGRTRFGRYRFFQENSQEVVTFTKLFCCDFSLFFHGQHPNSEKVPHFREPARESVWFAWSGTRRVEEVRVACLQNNVGTKHPQRAQRSKTCDAARNLESRSKILISLENFNLDVSISHTKIGPRWVARSGFSFSLEIFNLARNLEFF